MKYAIGRTNYLGNITLTLSYWRYLPSHTNRKVSPHFLRQDMLDTVLQQASLVRRTTYANRQRFCQIAY